VGYFILVIAQTVIRGDGGARDRVRGRGGCQSMGRSRPTEHPQAGPQRHPALLRPGESPRRALVWAARRGLL